MPWDWGDILSEQGLEDSILLKVHGSGLVVVDNYDSHKKMEGTGLDDGKGVERDILRQFTNLSVYQNQRGRLVKTQSLGPTPRVSDSVVLGLPYLNFSLGGCWGWCPNLNLEHWL